MVTKLASGGRLKGSKGAYRLKSGNPLVTIGTPSVSGPSQPSAPSVSTSDGVKTTTDGKTKVTTSTKAAVEHIYGGSPEASTALRQDFFNRHGEWPPCINTSCKSYGRPHPNCLCFGAMEVKPLAHGGEVCSGDNSHHESCEHFASPEEVQTNQVIKDPRLALDASAVHHGLLGLMTKTGHSKSPDQSKSVDDFITSVKRGKKSLDSTASQIFQPGSISPDKPARESLKNHLQDLRENPEKALDVGGNLGALMPTHATHLAAKAANAMKLFDGLQPKQEQRQPLDEIMAPHKIDEQHYARHIDIANNPLMIVQHAKDGTLVPSDLQTLNTLYPSLSEAIKSKVGEALIEHKARDKEVPYKQRLSLSLLLGMPLDGTMTSQAMQSIIQSAGGQQMQNQQQKTKKATGVELKQIDKTNELYETPEDRRASNKQA